MLRSAEIEGCARCGGKLAIVASIEEPEVIARILAHLEKIAPGQYPAELPLGVRAPPSQALCSAITRSRHVCAKVPRPGQFVPDPIFAERNWGWISQTNAASTTNGISPP